MQRDTTLEIVDSNVTLIQAGDRAEVTKSSLVRGEGNVLSLDVQSGNLGDRDHSIKCRVVDDRTDEVVLQEMAHGRDEKTMTVRQI